MSDGEVLTVRAKRCLSGRGGDDPAQPALHVPCKGERWQRSRIAGGLGRGLQNVCRAWRRVPNGDRCFSSLLSMFSLQLKLPVRSGSHFAFSWAVCPWIMAYPDVYSREVNKTPWESRTLFSRRGMVSALSQVQGSYLVPILRCEQERLPPWTHTSGSSLFSGHSLPSQPKGYTSLELMTSLLDHPHSRYPRPWNLLPKQPRALFQGFHWSLLWVGPEGRQSSQNTHS